ncbi:MAG: glycyl-radical enzyme activating protein [Pirellulales bacterium]|nr:glycyl-radical enzyme activating protein [Pirellulales bacterium]
MTEGVITHIQRFSVHDGPGIRTTVFLKGCQMRCAWCHNPETLRRAAELQVFAELCIGCGACVERCRRQAHEVVDDSRVFHRDRCVGCGRCAQTCYAKALVLVGETRTADEVAQELFVDREFYESSGGGVTISGGEPLMQPEFTRAILALCKRNGIHTALETNFAREWSFIEPLLTLVDLFCVDIKLLDDVEHKKWTGISNRQTLDNLRRLDTARKPVIVRTPVIAGLNDRPEQIHAIVDWLGSLFNVIRYELLPYHPLGAGKYLALGHNQPPQWFKAPAPHIFEQLTQIASLQRKP